MLSVQGGGRWWGPQQPLCSHLADPSQGQRFSPCSHWLAEAHQVWKILGLPCACCSVPSGDGRWGGVHLQGTVKGAEVSEPPGHPCLCTCFLMGLVWGCQCLEHPSRGAFPALQSSVALKTSLGNGLDEIGEGQTPSGLQRAPSRGEADGTPVRTSGQGSLLDRPEGMAAWGYQGLEG